MAILFTQAEVEARVAQAAPPLVVIDRRFDLALSEKDELSLSIQDVVGRTLNADVDSVFYLIGLAAKSNLAAAQKLQQSALTFLETAQAGNQAPPVAVTRIPDLLDLLDQAETSGSGRQKKIRDTFATTVATYARSSKTPEGAFTVGRDPAESRRQAILLANTILTDASVLLGNARLFVNAISNYKAVDMTAASRARHIMYARVLLEQHLGVPSTQQSGAILDAVVANTLLQYTAARLDVESPKVLGNFAISAATAGARTLTLTEAPANGLQIRIGDAVLAQALPNGTYPVLVGKVRWVNGLSVAMTEDLASGLPGGALNQNAAQYAVQIVPQGLNSFRSITPLLNTQVAGLGSLLEGTARVTRALVTYAESGVVSPVLTDSVSALINAVTSMATLFGQYGFSKVDSVEALLHHLEDERLALISSVLSELRFLTLLDIPSVLSEQAEATYLLEELANDARSGTEPEITETTSQFGDYFRSGGTP